MTELERLRNKLTDQQRKILTTVWEYYREHAEWIPFRVLHHIHGGKSEVWPNLEQMGGSVVFEQEEKGHKYYRLTILGILLTDDGDNYERLLVKYLEYMVRKCKEDPFRTEMDSQEVASDLKLEPDRVALLGELIIQGHFYSQSSTIGSGVWRAGILDDVEDLPQGLLEYVHERVMEQYDLGTPVTAKERSSYDWKKSSEALRRKTRTPSGEDARPSAYVDETRDGTLDQPVVFICYSQADMQFVDQLQRALEDRGVKTWRDVRDIPKHVKANTAGWDAAVEEGLQKSNHLLVVLSPASMSSEEVKNEIHFFLDEKKPIYPVEYQECEIYYRIRRVQRYFLNRDYNTELERLIRVLNNVETIESDTPETDGILALSNAVQNTRRLINDDNRIGLEEHIRSMVIEAYQAFQNDEFFARRCALINKPDATEQTRWADCLSLYFDTCRGSLSALVDLCWYGEERDAELAAYAVERWLEEPDGEERYRIWRYIPSLLLVYLMGMTALYRGKWAYLSAVFNQRKINIPGKNRRTEIIGAIIDELFMFHYDRIGKRQGKFPSSVGHDIQPILFPVFGLYHMSRKEYDNVFDLFELILALFNFARDDHSLTIFPLTEIPSPTQSSFDYIRSFWEHGGQQGAAWALLKTGLLARDPEQLESRLTRYQDYVYRLYESFYFPRLSGVPNYAGFYRKGLDSV